MTHRGIEHGYIWQFVTFQFFHASVTHLLFNLLVLYFVGRQIEEDFERGGLWRLFLLGGVAGGVAHFGFAEALPRYFGTTVLGASAGVSGLIAVFALLHPDLEFFLFPLPISFRARTLLWVDLGLAVYGVLVPSGAVANEAHLGGLLFGLGYVYWRVWEKPSPWSLLLSRSRIKRREVMVLKPQPGRFKRSRSDAAEPSGKEFISREVDPILDKISAHGIHSLTDGERRILENARNRMAKR